MLVWEVLDGWNSRLASMVFLDDCVLVDDNTVERFIELSF